MYAAQQLRGSVGAWWASNIAALPVDHQVPWGEFRKNLLRTSPIRGSAPHQAEGVPRPWARELTPLNWIEPGGKVIFGPDLVEEAKTTIRCIQDSLRAEKSHQETYADKRHRPLEFEVGDHVYFRVSPTKGVKRFRVKGKLAPHYIGPFPILEKCGTMAYKLDLPPSLARIHDIFHVSQQKKCLKPPVDVVLP
jgi:hypothetical protein